MLWVAFAGDIVILSWVVAYTIGYRFLVALCSKEGKGAVADDRAAEILSHFVAVGPFAEVAEPAEPLAARYPGVRWWMGMPYEAIGALAALPKAPALIDEPLNAHLLAVRKHLPDKLPFGWSPPLAITEPHPDSEWKDGAWLIDDDDACIVACLTGSQGRAKLMVMIFHPDGTTVDSGRASSTLKHFRGIDEFAQTELSPDEPRGARVYLGELNAATGSASPN